MSLGATVSRIYDEYININWRKKIIFFMIACCKIVEISVILNVVFLIEVSLRRRFLCDFYPQFPPKLVLKLKCLFYIIKNLLKGKSCGS